VWALKTLMMLRFELAIEANDAFVDRLEAIAAQARTLALFHDPA
jgi:hypothetical protein